MALPDFLAKYAKDSETAYGHAQQADTGKEWSSVVIEKAH